MTKKKTPTPSPAPTPPSGGASAAVPTASTGLPALDPSTLLGLVQSASVGSSSSDPDVYMGETLDYGSSAAGSTGYGGVATPKAAPLTQRASVVAGQFFDIWGDPQQRKSLTDTLVQYGLIDPAKVNDYTTVQKAWNDGVNQASQAYAAGKKWTPLDTLKMMGIKDTQFGADKGTHSTVKDIQPGQPLDPLTVKNTVNGILQQQLGRDANPDEIREFSNMLNTAISQSPTVQTTRTDTDGTGTGTRTTTTSGGVTEAARQQMVTDAARKKPEAAAFQASTTYMDALYSLLGSSGPHGTALGSG